MAKLYELVKELDGFEFEFDEETGEVLNNDELTELSIEFNDKVQNCIRWTMNKKAEAYAIKAEINRLKARQKSAEHSVERMEDYIARCLDGEKWESADRLNKVTYRKSEVVHADVDSLEERFVRVRTTVEPDKTAIKNAIKNGEDVAGAYIEEKQNIKLV